MSGLTWFSPNNFRLLKLRNRGFRAALFFAIFFLLLFLRRSAQLLHPQVWDEDGTQVLPGLIDHGLLSLAYPVNGYLITVPKLISALALSISGLHFPLISTLVVCTCDSLVCVAISTCPTCLHGGILLGVFTLLVPSDPEVFGVPLYSLWWASLLLFLVVLWDDNSQDLKWRVAFVFLGGLSSPIIFLVTPFLFVRTLLFKKRARESAILTCAMICCALQLIALHRSHAFLAGDSINFRNLRLIVPKFLGWYLIGNLTDRLRFLWIAGAILAAFVTLTSWRHLREKRQVFLMGLWLGSVLLAGARLHDLSIPHPRLAGPRYFFFPFVLLSWYVVSVFATSQKHKIKGMAAAVMLISMVNALPVLSRTHNDFRWEEHVSSCGRFARYSIPISVDGNSAWSLELGRDQCRSLQNAGLLSSLNRFETVKSYPYTAKNFSPAQSIAPTFAPISAVYDDGWNGSDTTKSTLPGFFVIGSVRTSYSDTGTVSVKLHRGDKVLFRSGSVVKHQHVKIDDRDAFLESLPVAPDWTILDFSNGLLPDEFTATFRDDGTSPGEWSSIALRN